MAASARRASSSAFFAFSRPIISSSRLTRASRFFEAGGEGAFGAAAFFTGAVRTGSGGFSRLLFSSQSR
ncbi:hypothetical protein D3C83_156340 [compost metagenome]